jgi:hypothetical protein
LIADPISIQIYFNSGLVYGLMKILRVPRDVAAPGARLGDGRSIVRLLGDRSMEILDPKLNKSPPILLFGGVRSCAASTRSPE